MSHHRSPQTIGLCWHTAGESHGPALVAILEGLPVGFAVDVEAIQVGMLRRWQAPGRGKRAKFERDKLTVLSGLKRGISMGTPLSLMVANADTKIDELPDLSAPRPGHVDLPGVLRNRCRDIRALLERASARETAARTAMGEVAAQLLAHFGIEANAFVSGVAGLNAPEPSCSGEELAALIEQSSFFGAGPGMDEEWLKRIEQANENGDSLGGRIEVRVQGCPPGLGGFEQPVDRLDARLMAALASLPAIKGVSVGAGFSAADMAGSGFHDGICVDADGWAGLARESNNAGGIEGGLSNGQTIFLSAAMKPIPTMRRGAPSVNLSKHEESRATYERSDVCAVSAASVVGRAVVCLELASALRARLGGVSLPEMEERFAQLGEDQRPSQWPKDISFQD